MRILLRPYRLDDFETSLVIRGIHGQEKINRWRERFDHSGGWHDHYLHLGIDCDGELVGDLQMRHCDKTMPEGVLELGIEILPNKQGCGIGTEVLTLAPNRFFSEGVHRISGSTDSENKAMIRAFEKAKWKYEGTLYGLFKEESGLRDYRSYSILKSLEL